MSTAEPSMHGALGDGCAIAHARGTHSSIHRYKVTPGNPHRSCAVGSLANPLSIAA